MVEDDTIKLLRECDSGIKMGISAIDDVIEYVKDNDMKRNLQVCKADHQKLDKEIQILLEKYNDTGKTPNAIAKGMAHIKTSMKLNLEEADCTIADLMTDGCDMGAKSLSMYLNKYKAADEQSKDIAKKLIQI